MDDKVKIPIRIDIIESFAALCFSKNQNILFRDFLSLKSLISKIDTESIEVSINGVSSSYYFELVNFFLEEKVVKKVHNNKFIIGKLLEESSNQETFKTIAENVKELSTEDLNILREYINERIRYLYLYMGIESIDDLLLDLRTNNYNSLAEMSERYEEVIKRHFSVLTRTKTNQTDVLNDLELNDEGLITLSTDLHSTLNMEGFTLGTGIKEFDEIFPIVRGELTLLGGPSGGFKSGTLLNLFYNCRLYNKNIKCKDPTKKPAILYISMENTQKITFARSIKLVLNMNRAEVKITPPEILTEKFKSKLEGYPEACTEAVSKLKYFRGNTVSIEDIYGIIEEEEQDGNEVVAIFIDYIKSLKAESRSKGSELRIQMSDSSRAMADLAISKEIAVVSAFQLNRLAIEARTLNPVHIQEAFSIIDHADNVAFIRKVFSPNLNRHFLQVFDSKMRNNEGMTSNKESYFIPFDKDNSFRLVPTRYEKNEFENVNIDILLPSNDNKQGGNSNHSRPPPRPTVAPLLPEYTPGTTLGGKNKSVFSN